MHTTVTSPELKWLFPEVREAVLAKLLLSDRPWYMRELARAVGMAIRTVAVELKGLDEAGIAIAVRSGNRVYYRANPDCPIYPELKNILVKTVGIAEPIKQVLKLHAERIKLAYIYGSFADGTATSRSDVDLMIVGGVTLREATAVLRECELMLGREVNSTVCSEKEYREKLALGSGFVYEVHRGRRIILTGEELEP